MKKIAALLRCCLCTSIVTAFQAFQPHDAAALAVSEDVRVPGGAAAFARALGVDPVPDRGRFMYEVTRIVHEGPEIRNPAVAAFLLALGQKDAKAKLAQSSRLAMIDPGGRSSEDAVPVPLTSELWGNAVFHRRVAPDELAGAIVADRQAALLCHGLASLDDPTLEYLAEHPALITRLYERSAPLVAAFAGSLSIRSNRVVPPGGADAAGLWETAVNERVTRPDRFVTALFELYDGRLAYLYDTIGQLDPPHRAFVLGAWMSNATAQREGFLAFVTAGLGATRDWHVRALPFGRQVYDLAMGLVRLEVAPDGTPRAPAGTMLWSRVFGGADPGDAGRIDAAWLAAALGPYDARQRGDRLDQIGFAQRVLGEDAVDPPDAVFLIRAFPRFRTLLLTLERMGIRKPEVYRAAVRHASTLSSLEARRGFVAQSQLQASLAILARLRRVGTLDLASTERLLVKLFTIPIAEDGRYAGAIGRWLESDLRPALPPGRGAESALVGGLAGPPADARASRRVTWEGRPYRLDLAAAERQRLARVREKQGGVSLDVPLQLGALCQTLQTLQTPASDSISLDDLQDVVLQLTTLATDIPQQSRDEEAENTPAGVSAPQSPHATLRRVVDDLNRAIRSRDRRRASRAVEPLVELEDEMLARTLVSFAYAIDLGDPDGTALLAGDVSRRHDFGFGVKDSDMRARVAWSIPRQDLAPGVPWHLGGSLLGLDVALSSLALRRVSADHVLEAPKLTSTAREVFATSVALLDPVALRDADRDAIAAAIERGRARILSATDGSAIDALADELAMEGARRRALRWTRAREPEALPSMLSLTELLTLGGERPSDLHAWGMAALATSGCLCSRLLPPGRWPALAGRPVLGLAAVVLPDLNLRVAVVMKQLGLPSALAKTVLAAATQDFIDEAKPTDDGDWLTLSRAARTIARERIEDYVAAATANGPLVPDTAETPQ